MNATSSYLNRPPREHAEVYPPKPGKRTLSPLETELLAIAKRLVYLAAQPRPRNAATAAGEGLATRKLVADATAAIAKAEGR